jgi:steroid delta-isomerase-like uncharacterized protein
MSETVEVAENKEVVLRWAEEVLNQRRIDTIDELMADDFTWRMPFAPEPLRGPRAMKEIVSAFLGGFSDFAVEVKSVLAEGDKVALEYTASGTNDGEFLGSPPTGRRAEWTVLHIFTLRDEKVAEDVTVLDRLTLMQQLGRA